jgi:hypothetical protein
MDLFAGGLGNRIFISQFSRQETNMLSPEGLSMSNIMDKKVFVLE